MAAPKVTYQMASSSFRANLDSLPEWLRNDATIACTADGGVLSANMFILAIGSEYFRDAANRGRDDGTIWDNGTMGNGC